MRKEEEPLAGRFERVLAHKLDHQPLVKVPQPDTHDHGTAVPKDYITVHAHVVLGVRDRRIDGGLLEVDDIPPIVALVLRRVPVDLSWSTK